MIPSLLSPSSRGAVSAQAQGPSAATSTVTTPIGAIEPDGSAYSLVTITCKDSAGVVLAGHTPTATHNGTDAPALTFSASNASGISTAQFTSEHTAGETVTVTGFVAGRQIPTTASITVNASEASAAPTITSVSPSTGSTAGGTLLTITGTGFQGGAAVTVGGHDCTSETVVSSTSITCLTPAHAAEAALDVVVTNTDEQTSGATGAGLFTYAEEPAYDTPDVLDNASFETGWDGFTDGGGGTPHALENTTLVRTTAQAYAGSYSVAYGWVANTADQGAEFIRPLGGGYDRVWCRFYMRLSSGWSISPEQKFCRFRAEGYGTVLGGWFLTDAEGLFWGYDQENSAVKLSLVAKGDISTNAWHSVEVDYWRNGESLPSVAVWFDGTPVVKADGSDPTDNRFTWASGRLYPTGVRGSSEQVGMISWCGTRNGGNVGTGTCWLDRIAISSLGRIGP